jgi:hypothetical protein
MIAPAPSVFKSAFLFAETSSSVAIGGVSLSTGLLVVAIAALLVLARLVADLRARVTSLENSNAPASPGASLPASAATAAASSTPARPPSAQVDAVPPEILAVIAAAIHVTLGREARIVGVTPARIDDHTWSLEGRRQIFHSHKVR